MKYRAFLGSSLTILVAATAAACSSSTTGGAGGHGASSSSGAESSGSGSGSSNGSGSSSGSGSAGSSASSGGGGGSASGRWVSGYYVGYQQNLYPPDAINWNGLTHLMIGRVTPQPDGSLNTTFDIDAVNGPALAKKLVTLAHQHGKKAIVMLGGAGEHAGWVGATSAANLVKFEQNLLQLAKDYGFDGFDFDWEPINGSDQVPFQALVQEMRKLSPNAILTVPVGWVSANDPGADAYYAGIAGVFDQINIMSYGMAGTWPGWESWHSSALLGESPTTPSSVDSSVKAYLKAGIPAHKLGIGIGFYGSCWSSPVNAPKMPIGGSTIIADDNIMSFTHIMSAYYSAANHKWDASAMAPYLTYASAHGPEGCTWVSYEDAQSILEKGKYVASMGLGGAIVWTINEGYLPSQPIGMRDPLMDALAQGFLK